MRKNCKCGMTLYGYGDGVHEVWICYKCGRFVGKAGGDPVFGIMLKTEPTMIMDMIYAKQLKPIGREDIGQR